MVGAGLFSFPLADGCANRRRATAHRGRAVVEPSSIGNKRSQGVADGVFICTGNGRNRVLPSHTKEVTNGPCNSLGNLALATGKNKRVDYR